jgi:predicted nucleotidyltransferase
MRAREFIYETDQEEPGQEVVDAILAQVPNALEIWFHGSRATGTHRYDSDTDILVVVPEDVVGRPYVDIVFALQKIASKFHDYDIQPDHPGGLVHQNAQEEGELLWKADKLDEMALPADWDPTALGHDKTFKSRLEYALQRARRLGGGSSRVAFVIPDNGRETVLKIAKNNKGTAQNEAEVDILADGYTGKLDIVIPIVDYDKKNPQPTWIQTELAKKVSQQKLSKLLHSEKLNYGISHFVYAVHNVLGNRKAYMPDLNKIKQDLITSGHTEQDIEIFMGYVDEVATLVNSSSLLVDDLGTASNWGEYNGRPVIIDLGFTEAVKPMYTRGWR